IPVVNPNPAASSVVITSVDPTSVKAGGSAFTIIVNGANFTTSSKVVWTVPSATTTDLVSTDLTTTFQTVTQLTAAVPASLITAAGTATITVSTDSLPSNPLTFTITQ